ncbi:MAG: hypothetical protein IT379_34270 [Deltaproteobacteria bacterium]|nr:hypothetical protein [Deltaproteobacteria bacterium]
MSNTPHAILSQEWREIAELPFIVDGFGLRNLSVAERARELEGSVYGVRFDFVSGGPGYVGDVYIIQGDALGAGPIMLTRAPSGDLEVFDA